MDTDKYFNDTLFNGADEEVASNAWGIDDNKGTPEPEESVESDVVEVSSFDEMGLKDELLRGLYSYGFEKPSKIQCRAIPMVLTKGDVIAQSQSGTGKTGAFSISTLQLIDEKEKSIQAIIISPTHELSRQTHNVMESISTYMKVSVCTVIGGTNVGECKCELQKNPHIVVGTPGRILDMINKKYLDTSRLKIMIFDEADEILSSGFKDTIYNIVKQTNKKMQMCLFSATIPKDVIDLTDNFMNKPKRLLMKNDVLTLEGIKQYYVNTKSDNWKYDVLIDIYETISISQCIIYCNSKKRVNELGNTLQNNDFPVLMIHGELNSNERKDIMERFKSGEARILISTDLLARGIDVQQLSLVINFDLPIDNETYIHRIGRSGRYGRKGIAINFMTDRDVYRLKDIEKFYNTVIEEMPGDFINYLT
jgi:superfamily II DNA/RNA helicase